MARSKRSSRSAQVPKGRASATTAPVAKEGQKRLSAATIDRLGGAELRAIGYTRGYQISADKGKRAIRIEFTEQQKKDHSLPAGEI